MLRNGSFQSVIPLLNQSNQAWGDCFRPYKEFCNLINPDIPKYQNLGVILYTSLTLSHYVRKQTKVNASWQQWLKKDELKPYLQLGRKYYFIHDYRPMCI